MTQTSINITENFKTLEQVNTTEIQGKQLKQNLTKHAKIKVGQSIDFANNIKMLTTQKLCEENLSNLFHLCVLGTLNIKNSRFWNNYIINKQCTRNFLKFRRFYYF